MPRIKTFFNKLCNLQKLFLGKNEALKITFLIFQLIFQNILNFFSYLYFSITRNLAPLCNQNTIKVFKKLWKPLFVNQPLFYCSPEISKCKVNIETFFLFQYELIFPHVNKILKRVEVVQKQFTESEKFKTAGHQHTSPSTATEWIQSNINNRLTTLIFGFPHTCVVETVMSNI